MNYALEPEKQHRFSVRRIVAIILIIVGLVSLGIAAWLVLPDIFTEQKLQELSEEVINDDDGEVAPEDVDWDHLRDIDGNIKAWLAVDNTTINYPIAQGDDNDYYLHHDIYGNYSYDGVFADYRADINGDNIIVYGHHMSGGRMFSPVAATFRSQGEFDEIGTLHWTTKEGITNYEPAFAMSVDMDYGLVQRFDFTPEPQFLDVVSQKVAMKHGLKAFDSMTYEVLPTIYQTEALAQAKDENLRIWLKELSGDAETRSANLDYLIENADRSIILCTCSSGIGGMPWRTYTVFVKID